MGDLVGALDDVETAAGVGIPLVGTIIDLIVKAVTASREEHAAIVKRFRACEDALTADKDAAHAAIDEETAKSEKAIADADASKK